MNKNIIINMIKFYMLYIQIKIKQRNLNIIIII